MNEARAAVSECVEDGKLSVEARFARMQSGYVIQELKIFCKSGIPVVRISNIQRILLVEFGMELFIMMKLEREKKFSIG